MELVKILIYIFILMILAIASIFNAIYRHQIKKAEKTMYIETGPLLGRLYSLDAIAPLIILLIGLFVLIFKLNV